MVNWSQCRDSIFAFQNQRDDNVVRYCLYANVSLSKSITAQKNICIQAKKWYLQFHIQVNVAPNVWSILNSFNLYSKESLSFKTEKNYIYRKVQINSW